MMETSVKRCGVLLLCWCCLWGSAISNAETPAASLYEQVIDKLEHLTPGNAINIVMASKQEQYEIGDPFEIRFRVSEESYVTLMHIAVDGTISFLTPNVLTPNQKVDKMRVYSTRKDFKLPIKVSPPTGTEVVNLFCSPEKFDFFQADLSKKEPFYIIPPDDEDRLQDLLVRLETLEHIEWSGGGIQFQVGDNALVAKGAKRDGFFGPREAGGFLPPIATTGTAGMGEPLFPPISVTGTAGHSDDPLAP